MERIKARMAGKALPAVFFTIFLDVLGIGILIPVIPQLLVEQHSVHYLLPAGLSYNTGLILLGWLMGIYPLMQFIATPILGQLSDRYGRKKILSVSLAGTAIGYFLFAIAIITKNLPLLFFSRALDGITGGNISVAQAVVADVTPPQYRTKMFGFIGATFGFGFVLGPYIGAKLSSPNIDFFGLFSTPHWFNAATPFWFAAVLSVINALLITLFLPETIKSLNRHLKVKFTQSIHHIIKAATHPGLRVVFPSVFIYFSGFTFFRTFMQVFLIEKLHFSFINIGDYYAYMGIWIAVAQIVVTPFLAKRLKSYQVLRFSMISTGLAMLLILLSGNTSHLLMVTPFFAMFNGLTWVNSTSLVSQSAGSDLQGEVLGINASVVALAQAVPAILAGYIATVGVYTPVVAGSLIMISSGLLFWFLYRPSKHLVHSEPTIGAAH